MMNEMMDLAQVKQLERQDLVRNHALMLQATDVEKVERTRFLQAYRVRSLVNRVAPALAPRLGL